jgi:hypothetical protein
MKGNEPSFLAISRREREVTCSLKLSVKICTLG